MTQPHSRNTPPRKTAAYDARWRAVLARDAQADGTFYFSVSTTGIYCRPSCPSRRAKRENVAFHETCEAAEAAGFRPCKRCRPREASLAARQAALVTRACRAIEAAESPPPLSELARSAGLSAFHFQRLFKSVAGVTPRDYAAQCRRERVAHHLSAGQSVTEALHAAGFNSSGRFYAGARASLGMRPGEYRRGAAGLVLTYAFGQSSLGPVLVAATDKGIAAILIGDTRDELVHDLEKRFSKAELKDGEPAFDRLVSQVVGLVEHPVAPHGLPLDIQGTAFQQRVWQALQAIAPGETASYGEIARRIGSPKSVRAVARACGANPAAVAVPCHRAVGSDGKLTGYRWGLERKRTLLAREAILKGRS